MNRSEKDLSIIFYIIIISFFTVIIYCLTILTVILLK